MKSVDIFQSQEYNFMGYMFFWIGQLMSLLGSSIVRFAIVWWITLETGSTFLLGLSFFAAFGSEILFTSFAGVLVDRWNRKIIIIVSDFLLALNSIFIILFFYLGIINYWFILLTLIIGGICQSFHVPSVEAIIPILVPPEKLSRVNGWTYLANSIIFIIGPMFSATLLTYFKISDIVWIDIITFLIATTATIFITIPDIREVRTDNNNTFLIEFKEGIAFIRNKKGLLILLSVFTIANFVDSPFFSLLPLIVTQIHKGNVGDLAILQIFNNLGAFIGAIVMSSWKGFEKNVYGVFYAVLISYFVLLLISLTPIGALWMLGCCLFIYGFLIPIMNVSSQNIWQRVVPPEKRGRVFSARTTIAQLSWPIGTFINGLLAEFFGISIILFGNAMFGLIFLIFVWQKTNLRFIEDKLFSSSDKSIKKSSSLVESNVIEGVK